MIKYQTKRFITILSCIALVTATLIKSYASDHDPDVNSRAVGAAIFVDPSLQDKLFSLQHNIDKGNYEVIWDELFSDELQVAIPRALFLRKIKPSWSIDSINPLWVRLEDNTSSIIVLISELDNGTVSQSYRNIYMIRENGVWKFENFPFATSGIRLLRKPSLYTQGIWK